MIAGGMLRNWAMRFGVAALLALAAPAAALAQAREPVRFAHGATVANVSGNLQGRQVREYMLSGQQPGQAIEITVGGVRPDALFVRVTPSGRMPGAELPLSVGTNEANFRVILPSQGDYVVRVALRDPETERRGVVFNLRIALLSRAEAAQYIVVDFTCADRSALRVMTTQDRTAARIERMNQAWVLPRVETPQGSVRFSDGATSFTSRGEEGVLERRNLASLRCRQQGR